MQNYDSFARELIQYVGGERNIKAVTHCLTRLRFVLKDDTIVDEGALKAHSGVMALVQGGGQYQIVIGHHVSDVYDAVLAISNIENSGISVSPTKPLDYFMAVVSAVFQPSLGALAAAGMLKGLVAILAFYGLNATNSGIYVLLQATGDAFFQFLPIVLAINASKYFKLELFTGVALAATLLYPSLNAGKVLPDVFGFPLSVPMGGYYQTVLPIIVAVGLASVVEKRLKQIVPTVIKFFMVPFLTLLIVAPLTVIVVGPITMALSNWIGDGFQGLYQFSPTLLGFVLGGLWQSLVLFGLHWGLIPIMTIQLENLGFSPILGIISFVSFSQLGSVLAILTKTKDKSFRSLGISAALSAFCGVTEPAIYGLSLPFRTPFWMSSLAGALQGAYIGWTTTVAYHMGGLGIFALSTFVSSEGQGLKGLSQAVIAIVIATLSGFILTLLVKFPNREIACSNSKQETSESHHLTGIVVTSPLEGDVLPLEEINDPVFASEIFGKGVAIKPIQEILFAPLAGEVSSLFPTHHAISIVSESGIELLIHIGIDTVQLEGRGFMALVSEGDKIQPGQALIRFDRQSLEKQGFDLTTAIVVTNSGDYLDVLMTKEETVIPGEALLTVIGSSG